MSKPKTYTTLPPQERAFLIGVEIKNKPAPFEILDSMRELARLAETDGLTVVGNVIQRVDRLNPATLIGKGKLQDIVEARPELKYDALIFNEELAPNQQREIEESFDTDVKVLDRSALILDIFAQHARTREGALQVELAQYEYRLPRLTRMWTHLARQTGGATGRGGSGGVGLRGPGERQLELDRREIRSRIAHLKSQLEDVRRQRAEHRRKRKRQGIPVVTIVGYTNAGKSTLLNALTGAAVLTEDKLFATLDPTTRRVRLPGGSEILLTDTVGFIQQLPTQLVAAFRATLEEINDSNVLLHVVDVTDANASEQVSAVEETLEQIGASGKPTVIALNKIDQLSLPKNTSARSWGESGAGGIEGWLAEIPDAIPISARRKIGLGRLLQQVEDTLSSDLVPLRARIPYAAAELVSLFHRRGIVETEEFSSRGTLIEGRVPRALLSEFEAYAIQRG